MMLEEDKKLGDVDDVILQILFARWLQMDDEPSVRRSIWFKHISDDVSSINNIPAGRCLPIQILPLHPFSFSYFLIFLHVEERENPYSPDSQLGKEMNGEVPQVHLTVLSDEILMDITFLRLLTLLSS